MHVLNQLCKTQLLYIRAASEHSCAVELLSVSCMKAEFLTAKEYSGWESTFLLPYVAHEEVGNQFWLLDPDFRVWHLSLVVVCWGFFSMGVRDGHFHLLTLCKHCFSGQGFTKSSEAIATGTYKTV